MENPRNWKTVGDRIEIDGVLRSKAEIEASFVMVAGNYYPLRWFDRIVNDLSFCRKLKKETGL